MTLTHNEVEIDDAVVVINIHEQFPHVKNAQELYDCTKGAWRMRPKRAGKAKYFFAVFEGEIREAYEVIDCIPATDETKEYWRNRLLSQGRHLRPEVNEGRAEFVGQIASDDVRAKYVGKCLTVKLTQNPVRYFNC
ncbi:MAG TPA: hypothetical protein VEM96_08645 [Pyrinomonadaceae bacterium]|nr:hypothetical protein [Pyrinomonadaceae bacterium]